MALEKITAQQMDAKGVCAAPDVLNGTAAQNKAVFDRMIRELVAPAYNGAVDAINAVSDTAAGIQAAENIRIQAEDLRLAAEQGRDAAEKGRLTAEEARSHAETLRSQAERLREEAEQARAAAEQARLTAEAERVREEADRADRDTGIVARAAESEAAARLSAEKAAGSAQAAQAALVAAVKEADRAAEQTYRVEAIAEATAETAARVEALVPGAEAAAQKALAAAERVEGLAPGAETAAEEARTAAEAAAGSAAAAQTEADRAKAEADRAGSIVSGGDMNKADYDPEGAVSAAGGIPGYVAAHAPQGDFLPRSGGTMTGSIDMNNGDITGAAQITSPDYTGTGRRGKIQLGPESVSFMGDPADGAAAAVPIPIAIADGTEKNHAATVGQVKAMAASVMGRGTDTALEVEAGDLYATVIALPRLLKDNITITVKAGSNGDTLTGKPINLNGFYGPGKLVIQSADAQAPCTLNKGLQIYRSQAYISLQALKITSGWNGASNQPAVIIAAAPCVDIGKCVIAGPCSVGIDLRYLATASLMSCTIQNATKAALAVEGGSSASVENCTSTGCGAGIQTTAAGVVTLAGTTLPQLGAGKNLRAGGCIIAANGTLVTN